MLQVQSDQLAEQRKINALQAEDLEESLIISWHLGTMPKGQRYLTPLMPGAQDEDTQPVPPGADADKFGAVAFFRDAAGVTWRTRPDGQLDEIPAGQEPPHTW